MSVKNKLTFTTLCILAILFGSIAFVKNKKPSQISSPRQAAFTTGALHDRSNRIIKLEISSKELQKNNDSALISVKISMPFNFDSNVYYKWKLSEGVSLLEGQLSGQLAGISTSASELQIRVNGFSKKINRQVGFEIYGIKNGRKVTGDTIIASDQENSFEEIVRNVEKIKASEQ